MKRQQIQPSAPPQELYGLPPHYLRRSLDPNCSVSYSHHAPPSYSSSTELTYEKVYPPKELSKNNCTINKNERIARFEISTEKLKKRHNPQLYTKRGCTDVFCCFLFLVFTVGWAVVAVIGFMWGNPERLIFPTDSAGRRCGSSRFNAYNFTDKPYLLYFDITKCLSYATALGGCPTPQVCVSNCPTDYFSYLQLQSPSVTQDVFRQKVYSSIFCVDEINKDTITSFAILRDLIQSQKCSAYTVQSVAVFGRCFPAAVIGVTDTLNNLQNNNNSLDRLKNMFGDDANIPQDQQVKNSQTYIGSMVNSEPVISKMVHDLSKTWWQVLVLIAAAGGLAFLWTVIMRVLGSFMIWASILIVFLGLAAGCAYSWFKWNSLKNGNIDDVSFPPVINLYTDTWMIIAIVTSVILVILLLILLFVHKRILIAVALIEESSKAIGHMMSTLIFPIFPFILHLIVFAIWGNVAIWLSSSGQENCRIMGSDGRISNLSAACDCATSTKNSNCIYVSLTKQEDIVFWLQVYNLFAFFWMSCFVTALGDISLAGAFASHYWALDKSKDVPSFPVLRALARAIRYNLGSLAFGSLIIAIVKIIRVILEYLDKKLSKANNAVVKTIFTALKCCFWCMEVFFKFLTKNAYIMMAIYGQGFFTSAKNSFLLLTRNIVRAAVVNQVAGFLLFIGKAMITVGMGVVAFFYFSGKWVVEGIPKVDLYYDFVPIIIVLIGSYFMADLFFDVYEMAVDTTFICFLEDSEQNDGSPEKPFFMSKDLQNILGKINEKTTSSR